MKPTQSRTTLLFGFGLIIVILIALVATLLLHLKQNTQQLNQLVELENANTLMLAMRQTAMSRSTVLHSMILSDDPFFRDAQAMEFSSLVLGFIQARDKFERSPMSAARRKIWEQSQQNLASSQNTQARVIELLLAGDTQAAQQIFLDKMVPNQKENMRWMTALTNDLQHEATEISQHTADANHQTLVIMLTLGLVGVLVSLGAAFYATRSSYRTEHVLNASRDVALTATHSKSQFLANMSHEIRTPLTSIIGFAETLLDTQPNEAEKNESVHTIIRNGRHLLVLINDILDLSKIESDKLRLEIVDVSPLTILSETESLIGRLAREKGLSFETDITFPLPGSIQTDPTRLKQILLNLLNNAVKFTEKGNIRIRCRFDRECSQLYFEVQDSGIGMSAEELARLFQPFMQAHASTTRKYGGTGLGLNISKRLAELLGGDMTVDSVAGRGTSFRFHIATGTVLENTLVTHWEPASHVTGNHVVVDIPSLSGHVLVAEDSPDIQRLISMYIRKTGGEVTLAENGQVAVELVLASDFDLVLMDMQMPVTDGLEATAWLRKTGFNKPIIALTANAMPEDRERYRAAGADGFLSKPIVQAEFHALLKCYLNPAATVPQGAQDDSKYQDLVQRFTAGLPSMMAEMAQAMEQGNLDTVRSIAHKLKGMGGSFGYQEITNIATEIESLARDQRSDALPRHYDSLAQHIRRIAA